MSELYRSLVKDNLSMVETILEWRLSQGGISKIDLMDYFVPHLEKVQWLKEVFTDHSIVSATVASFDKNENFRLVIKNIYNEIIDLSYEYLAEGGFKFELDCSAHNTPMNSIVYMRQALMVIKEANLLRKRLEKQIPLVVSAKSSENSSILTSGIENEARE